MLKASFASDNLQKIALASALLVLASQGYSADLSLPVTGNLLGTVVDSAGAPQMGVAIQLFNKYHQLIAKASSDYEGRFAFVAVPIDLYSVHASLSSFLPAARDKIAVKAGLDSVLQIHMATLFSNMEVSYVLPTAAMSDDWKWVLRSSPATRPINRYLPVELGGPPEAGALRPRLFSETHALLSVSGGDGGLVDADSPSGDVGTGFALSTNFLGKNQLQFSGSLGNNMATAGPPAMAFGVIYSRNEQGFLGRPPEITLSMAEVGGVGSPNPALAGSTALRAMSLSIYEAVDPVESVHFEYGVTGESVDYLQHKNRISPFARLTVDTGKAGQWIAAYSDGGRPDELAKHSRAVDRADLPSSDDDLAAAVNALARLPQISSRNGRLQLQRTQNLEIGYRKISGTRTYALSAFYEDVTNGRINVAGNTSALDPQDLLSDNLSRTSTYNIGNYRRTGYIASVAQKWGDYFDTSLAYGRMGGFTADAASLAAKIGDTGFLTDRNRNIAAVNMQAVLPSLGTQITADYGWVDSGTLVPRHVFATQNTYVAPGFNIYFRQPMPSFWGLPGRFEITADLRNLLAQGYLPFDTGGGHRLLMVQAPRAIRGGVSFIF
ncbi:MAG: TonB-dependent receptor [Acidobacteriaceae bacterium]|nr:TonB-dependent receptor [Acidobacteriaceae bacterium]